MINRVLRIISLFTTIVLLTHVSTQNYREDDYEKNMEPNLIQPIDEELIRQMHSMMNAYRENNADGNRLIVETNALVNTKFKTWKRNADFINSLLALPKGMTDAGR